MSEDRSIWEHLNSTLSQLALAFTVFSNASFQNFNHERITSLDVTEETYIGSLRIWIWWQDNVNIKIDNRKMIRHIIIKF